MKPIFEIYQSTRQASLDFCSGLKDEDFLLQAAAFTSPLKWHLAHTSWFFEQLILIPFLPDYKVFNSDYGFLFNSYYNALGKRISRDQRALISRPNISEVLEYRDHIDEHMQKLLNTGISDVVHTLVLLGINHEEQHQELMKTDLKYNFFVNPAFPAKGDMNLVNQENEAKGWIEIDEGIYHIGHEGDDFCYDNELGRHRVFLESYSISRSLVTNGDYLEFINEGGYQNPDYWLDEAWSWVRENDIRHPLYWLKANNQWKQYSYSGIIDLEEEHILSHISFYEAAAFASFKGLRLATEFEWEVASTKFTWGSRWEWTNSAYLPYPGFKIAPGPTGEYNGKFMVNQKVLRGASSATSEHHSRNTYRNFFHPDAQWQFTGIRLAK